MVMLIVAFVAILVVSLGLTLLFSGGDVDMEHFLMWCGALLIVSVLGFFVVKQLTGPPQPKISREAARTAAVLRTKLSEAQTQRQALETRLNIQIPEFRRLLSGQVAQVRAQATGGTAADDELKEIAQIMVGLDKYEKELAAAIPRWSAIERRIERNIAATETLDRAEEKKLLADIQQEEVATEKKLKVELNSHIGRGVLANTEIEQKIQQLKGQ